MSDVDIYIQGGAKAQAKISAVVDEMCKSDAGRAVLEFAADYGYELKFDRQTTKQGIFGYADPCEEVCALNPKNTLAQNIVTLAHERALTSLKYFAITSNLASVIFIIFLLILTINII